MTFNVASNGRRHQSLPRQPLSNPLADFRRRNIEELVFQVAVRPLARKIFRILPVRHEQFGLPAQNVGVLPGRKRLEEVVSNTSAGRPVKE